MTTTDQADQVDQVDQEPPPGTVATRTVPIPTCLTRCCTDWVSPFGYRGGRCGLCGARPSFVKMLPESQWVYPRPPIRPEDVSSTAGSSAVG